MLDEGVFNNSLKKYEKELNEKIQKEGLIDLSELKLRQVLTRQIKKENENKEFNKKNVEQALEELDYLKLHKELQLVFNEFIPFILIRKFLKKVGKYGIDLVYEKMVYYKDQGFTNAMCFIRQ
jgi:hypothetical protein